LTNTEPSPESLLLLEHQSIEKIRRGIEDKLSNHIILQMSSAWSDKYLEESRDEITKRIRNEVLLQLDTDSQEWVSDASTHAHRWRYARPKKIVDQLDLEPIGTIEAAVESSKWAVAELLWNLNSNSQPRITGYQTQLF
jgi:predicted NAD/FAD-dependent oxidoreductase